MTPLNCPLLAVRPLERDAMRVRVNPLQDRLREASGRLSSASMARILRTCRSVSGGGARLSLETGLRCRAELCLEGLQVHDHSPPACLVQVGYGAKARDSVEDVAVVAVIVRQLLFARVDLASSERRRFAALSVTRRRLQTMGGLRTRNAMRPLDAFRPVVGEPLDYSTVCPQRTDGTLFDSTDELAVVDAKKHNP